MFVPSLTIPLSDRLIYGYSTVSPEDVIAAALVLEQVTKDLDGHEGPRRRAVRGLRERRTGGRSPGRSRSAQDLAQVRPRYSGGHQRPSCDDQQPGQDRSQRPHPRASPRRHRESNRRGVAPVLSRRGRRGVITLHPSGCATKGRSHASNCCSLPRGDPCPQRPLRRGVIRWQVESLSVSGAIRRRRLVCRKGVRQKIPVWCARLRAASR